MIKSNDLRLGNWVDYNDYPSKGFTRLNEHLMTCIFSDENWINHFISPIYLTEEILLKCENTNVSFSSDPQECGASKLYKIGDFYIHQPNEDESYFIVFINNEIKHVKYLHQLQNLYFALTNQDLNVEL